jgi:hypothetical protein
VNVPLREYEESLVGYRLRVLPQAILARRPSPAARLFADQLRRDETFALFLAGYLDGLWQGGWERVVVWKNDLEGTLTRLQKLLFDEAARTRLGKTIEIGIATGLWEFFARPLTEDVKSLRGISPAAAEAVGELELISDFEPVFAAIQVFENRRRATSFMATLGEFADSVAAALVEAATDRLAKILTEPDPERSGELLGEFVGAAIVEVVRLVVEPPQLAIADLVSLLALDPSEQQLLGIQEPQPR